MKIGIIAEELNDVEVIYEFTRKMIREKSFSISKFVGHGCGKLRSKCRAWATNLVARGCSYLIVVHDLDEWKADALRNLLSDSISEHEFKGKLLLIPVREIESWLLTDADALKEVFGMDRKPKVPSEPENLVDPKRKLREIVWQSARKRYVNTLHNAKIARATSLTKAKKCKSFRPHPKFIAEIVKPLL